MKRLLPILFFAFLQHVLFAQEIEVPQVQMSLITKKTATWCPYCGDWGWTMFKGLLEDNASKSLVIAAHYSGDLANDPSIAIAQNFGGVGQPRFYLGNADQGVSNGNVSSKRTAIKEAVDDRYANGTPLAQTGLKVAVIGKQATVRTATRFFGDAEGDYRLGVYLVRKSFNYYQSGKGSMADHSNLLTRAISEAIFGETLVSEGAAAGTTIDRDFSFEFTDAENPEDFMVATILWKANGTKFDFVNTNFTAELSSELSSQTRAAALLGSSVKLSPNPATDHFDLRFHLQKAVDSADVSIRDLNGKVVRRLTSGSLPAGDHLLQAEDLEDVPAGVYLLHFNLEGSSYALKWIKS